MIAFLSQRCPSVDLAEIDIGHRICIGGHVAVRVEVLGDRKISFHLVKVLHAPAPALLLKRAVIDGAIFFVKTFPDVGVV
jgi:hypothetical protein